MKYLTGFLGLLVFLSYPLVLAIAAIVVFKFHVSFLIITPAVLVIMYGIYAAWDRYYNN